ncbi:1,2-dihydroxy-3-keto-5-methylthiopentene dioxygenase [Drechslerella dactyloides]|uniref:Acireductone dioxygenase n=1 Tax=Drechslerella dactyloides TaxID=74499 RepID=A0AAD6IUC2_DREDA|nr:1,2-dihydroxy-3-keto-5-methylthiopentene dioxygenase [Drechslerella dactyloides]
MKIYYFDALPGDQREPHKSSDQVPESLLSDLSIIAGHYPDVASVDQIAKDRSYKNRDVITVSPDAMGDIYESKVKMFFDEHLHEDEEIRYILDGSGFFDVRAGTPGTVEERWVRIAMEAGDLIILPAGIYHRFTTDTKNYIKAMRLFKDEPKWTALNRSPEVDANPFRQEYVHTALKHPSASGIFSFEPSPAIPFRNQDFADLPIQQALDFGSYFGRHHIHPTSGGPEGHPEVHLVHRSVDDTSAQDFLKEHSNSLTWHSDVTYEKQPPGTTSLYLLDGPLTGGDTLFANLAQAYNRLSPEFRKRLHGLKAAHSAHEQAVGSLSRGGIVRREPITSVHPVVREHPVTKEKALFVNPQLKSLVDWDNRVTFHSAILDWFDGHRRHLARITPQAEAPYEPASLD